MKRMAGVAVLLLSGALLASAQWVDLFNGKNLDGWEKVGDGVWSVMKDGTLVGQRDLKTAQHQAWLYTAKEFAQYDLQLEYWLRHQGNSGISIRDKTRAQYAHGSQWDRNRTPSHNGYEIQLSSGGTGQEKFPTGSVYLFAPAKPGMQVESDWNKLEIRSRTEGITVLVNGKAAAEHPGDPERVKTGPIGLQLHDKNTVVMFRNIRIREVK